MKHNINRQVLVAVLALSSASAMTACRMEAPKNKPGYSDAAKIDAEKIKKDAKKKLESEQKAKGEGDKTAEGSAQPATETTTATPENSQANNQQSGPATEVSTQPAPTAPEEKRAEQGQGQQGQANSQAAEALVMVDQKSAEVLMKLESANNQAEKVKVGCQDTAELATVSDLNADLDLIFLQVSEVLLAASNDKNEDLVKSLSCFTQRPSPDFENENVIAQLKLKVGATEKVEVKINGKKIDLEVACSKDIKTSAQTLRGVVLQKGSHMVVNAATHKLAVICK